jgi:hypothetical protein
MNNALGKTKKEADVAYPDICLYSQCSSQDLNQVPPESKQ